MFSRTSTRKSIVNFSDDQNNKNAICSLKAALDVADAVIIGAGSGLSTAAGFTYSGERFEKNFGDFAARFGIRDIYSGGFYPFPNPNTFWAWWSRHIWLNRYVPIPTALYQLLLALVRDKDYFVLTTNVDHCFQRAGFDKERLFYTQGDYGLFQSADPKGPSAGKTYDNEKQVREMILSQGFEIAADGGLTIPESVKLRMEIPSDLIPVCPDDGGPVTMNLRSDDTFVEDAGWHAAAASYGNFLARYGIEAQGFFTADSTEEVDRSYEGQVLFLELGVGANTPGIIKYPFWQMTYDHEKAVYACVNRGEALAPKEIRDRSIVIDGDIRECIEKLWGAYH